MAVLKLCDPSLDATQTALLARISELEKAVRSGVTAVPAQPETNVVGKDSVPDAPPPAPEQPVSQPEVEAPLPTPVSDEEVPFNKWAEVLETLLTSCPPLYGVLAQSQAVLKGEMLLICTDNELFKELLKQDNNKTMLADAIRAVAGKTYRLGLRRTMTVQKEKNDPLSQLLAAARKADVPVSED